MNMNQIVTMFTRMVMGRAMNWGITKGMQTLSSRKTPPESNDPAGPAKGAGTTPRRDQDLARKMRNLNRMNRR